MPRFTAENRKANAGIVELVKRVAAEKKVTPAQIALAWLLAKEKWIVPIPGTTKVERLEENLGAAAVELTAADVRELDEASARLPLHGERYNAAAQAMIDR